MIITDTNLIEYSVVRILNDRDIYIVNDQGRTGKKV